MFMRHLETPLWPDLQRSRYNMAGCSLKRGSLTTVTATFLRTFGPLKIWTKTFKEHDDRQKVVYYYKTFGFSLVRTLTKHHAQQL